MVYAHRNAIPHATLFAARGHERPITEERGRSNVAAVYNQAGAGYGSYADGDLTGLFAFDGLHAYSDRCVWATLDALLVSLKESGQTEISILNAGSGPGTWLRRLVTRAHALGFTKIDAHGFDISTVQIGRAKRLAQPLATLPGVPSTFGWPI